MPFGAAQTEGSSGEYVSHIAVIRVRVTGVGNLLLKVFSLDDIKSKTLVPFKLQKAGRVIPTRLVNFTEQRVSFELRTSAMEEKFRINRIVVFAKQVATSRPGA
jgi:hypothetical protein